MRLVVAAAVSSDFARQDLRLLIPKSGPLPEGTTRICACYSESSCASVARVEYNLVMRFGILFSFFVNVSASFLLLDALLRAPEVTKMRMGFIIGAVADAVPL